MIKLKMRHKRKHVLCAVTFKSLVIGLCLVLSFLTMSIAYADSGASEVFLKKSRKLPVYCVQKEEKIVALSFDAAYGSDKTEEIMQTLKKYNATATFFLVGFWVDKYPDMTSKIHQNGFEIGTHSNNHSHMSKMSAEDISNDLVASITKIENITGKKPTVFRAPYGEYNDTLISESEKLGLQTVQWDVDSLDWKGISGDEITTRVVSRVKPGSIVLFHNNSDHILDSLDRILELLTARGYTFSTVGDILYKENYVIDNNGMQIPIVEDKK